MSKCIVGSLVVLGVILGGGGRSWGEPPAPRGELRIVDKHPQNWAFIAFNIFEHLVEYTPKGRMIPRLATEWRWLDDRTLEMTLRRGVTFHNSEVFDAEMVKLNWDQINQIRQPYGAGTDMNFKAGSRLEIRDPYTVRFIFPEPDGGVLAKLSMMHLANRQFYEELGWGEKSW